MRQETWGTCIWRLPPKGDSWRTAAVCIRQPDNDVVVEVTGDADPDAVREQVSRILSLDIDGSGFAAIGVRDRVVGRLQQRYPGLRPVGFWSPYEAAAWAVISHRIRIMQAAAVKAQMAEQLGERLAIHGETLSTFPAPRRVAELEGFPGLFGRKPEYLRSLAEAALAGRLSARWLRELTQERALAELQSLPGIGRFSAELILLRGAGDPDYFPTQERRLHRAMSGAYGLGRDPSLAELADIAERWRPYRTWVALLFRTELEEDTGEISGAKRETAHLSG
jgi:DNA-3-methyladenine glycosylase II